MLTLFVPMQLWDLKTFQFKGSLHGHNATVYAVAVSNHGPNRLYSGSYDNTVKIWNLETFQCVQTLNRHTSSVDAIVVVKGKIFSAAADNEIKVQSVIFFFVTSFRFPKILTLLSS